MKNILFTIAILITQFANSQINVLVHYNGKSEDIEQVKDSLHFSYVELSKMNKVYSLVINSVEVLDQIKSIIKKPNKITSLGGWDMQGKFVQFRDSTDNFKRSRFKNLMKKLKYRNEDGGILERDYTDEELNKGVINQIYGWGKRQMEIDTIIINQ